MAQVTGQEGTAEYVKILLDFWKRASKVAPHIMRKVNFPESAKGLGATVKKAIDQADPNIYEEQSLSNQCAVEFYQTQRTVVAQLRQYLGSEGCEYVDTQVWAEDATQVGCAGIDPIQVALQ